MEDLSIPGIEVSIGTRMFNFFGLLALLHKLNKAGKEKIICSPLSNQSQIKISRRNIWGELYHGPPIHLMWSEKGFMDSLTTDYLFDDNIEQCKNSSTEFITVSLFINTPMGDHSNYIIIHDNEAYRIEPHGHGHNPGNYDAEKLDKELQVLFNNYGIRYESHTDLSKQFEFSTKGLQTLEYDQEISKIPLKPGLCNTYVFMYIEEICEFKIHSDLRGYELFAEAINDVDVRYGNIKGEADAQAISYNLWLLQIQQVFHTQLIEARLLYKKNTRAQSKKIINDTDVEARKLGLSHFSVNRKVLDIVTMEDVLYVIVKLDQLKILTIYGLDFIELYKGDPDACKLYKKRKKINGSVQGDSSKRRRESLGKKRYKKKKGKKRYKKKKGKKTIKKKSKGKKNIKLK